MLFIRSHGMDVKDIKSMGRKLKKFLSKFDDCFGRSEPRSNLAKSSAISQTPSSAANRLSHRPSKASIPSNLPMPCSIHRSLTKPWNCLLTPKPTSENSNSLSAKVNPPKNRPVPKNAKNPNKSFLFQERLT